MEFILPKGIGAIVIRSPALYLDQHAHASSGAQNFILGAPLDHVLMLLGITVWFLERDRAAFGPGRLSARPIRTGEWRLAGPPPQLTGHLQIAATLLHTVASQHADTALRGL